MKFLNLCFALRTLELTQWSKLFLKFANNYNIYSFGMFIWNAHLECSFGMLIWNVHLESFIYGESIWYYSNINLPLPSFGI